MIRQFYGSIFQIIFLFLFMMAAVLIQGGWALWDYRLSDRCCRLDCGMLTDLFHLAVLPLAFICVMNIAFFTLTSNRILSTATSFFVLMSSCLIIDMEVLIQREAMSSAYENVWDAGLHLAEKPILIVALVSICPFYYLSRKISFNADW